MNAYHNSREEKFRTPFGAVQTGTELTIGIDIWDGIPREAVLRVWEEGRGETRVPMEINARSGGFTASCRFAPQDTGLCWYRFEIVDAEGSLSYYGAEQDRQGGVGKLYPGDRDCPSYQITVYKAHKLPQWYREGIVYQIFPDRFARAGKSQDEHELALKLQGHAQGPQRRIVPWDKPVSYERNADGSIAAWDFYGGSLAGIRDKLPYLKSLGVSVIYINPIFEAASSHRYDTGDYMHIDPLLGTEEDLNRLCTEAGELGISVILDGVFNHTGCDSIYFNKYGNYDGIGAYQSTESPYRSWYSFNNDTKDGYDSWWGVGDLPSLNESEPGLKSFIYGENDADKVSVVRKWLRAGARGWRLDVADELPDDFIAGIRQAITEETGDNGLLLGEVWEDASNKEAYGIRRRYLLGDELDCVMNYPFRDGTCAFLTGSLSADEFAERMYTLLENYPKEAFYGSLNLIGSHDKERILTVLGGAPASGSLGEEERAQYKLSDSMKGLAKARLWLAALMQMTMPGVPCIYYGDEAGLEGYADPYNRAPYPWDGADADCTNIYRNAVGIRRSHRIFTDGDFEPFAIDKDVCGYTRRLGQEAVTVLINRSTEHEKEVELPCLGEYASDIISGRLYACLKDSDKAACDYKLNDNIADSGKIASDKAENEAAVGADGTEDTAAARAAAAQTRAESRIHVKLNRLGSAVIYFAPQRRLGKALAAGTGVLCHITSLPNEDKEQHKGLGHGVIGDECFKFIDFLKARGDRYWQILPLNPTDAEGSPYAGSSAFAGNISLLSYSEDELRTMYDSFKRGQADKSETEAYTRFISDNAYWLNGYAMYAAVKERMHGRAYSIWDKAYQSYNDALWKDKELGAEADYHRFCQYIFDLEWGRVRSYAAKQGISIIGDMPIYVSADSADAWEYGEFFDLGEEAGVPPDYFSADGQNWGNPLYNWDLLRRDGYGWWMRRFERAFSLYDVVRLDHFRGFEAYWAIPKGAKAGAGHWMPGPGIELFEQAYKHFGPLPIIAEDLGYLTPGVRSLIAGTGFPGMDVMQFSDTDPRTEYKPALDRVSYTGTHDNETLLGWCRNRYKQDIDAVLCRKGIKAEESERYAEAFNQEAKAVADSLLHSFYETDAFIRIVPLQDILGLGNEARMNTPGTVGRNWKWNILVNRGHQ